MENIAQAWNDITLESAEFVLEQAEKRMQATIDLAKSISDRAVNIMQFSIPLSIALIGLIVTEPQTEMLWFYVIILAILITISYMSLRVFDLYKVKNNGHKPSELLSEHNLLLEGEDQRLGFIISALIDLEKTIAKNESKNSDLERRLFYAILLMKAVILVSGVSFATGLLIPWS